MSRTFVCIGPTLPQAEVRELLPGAEILPPVQHGDLLRLDTAPGDRVLIIDGLFLQVAPVRHREILFLLEAGVTVAGSSSMGALRAAELWPFGMRGVGEVFRLYRDGVITGDDEVAIVHGPADTGHGALSQPLVNIRVALREATAAGVLTAADAATLLEMARSIPFRSRAYRTLGLVARTWRAPDGSTVPMSVVEDFLRWAAAHAEDVKAADARLLLSLAAAGHPSLCPAGPGDQPIVNTHTHHLRSWHAQHSGHRVGDRHVTRTQEVSAVIVAHPDFPREHRRAVFADLVDGSLADADLERRALESARAGGLSADDDAGGWLLHEDADAPESERLSRLLVRAFGTNEFSSLGPATLPSTLDSETVRTAARTMAAEAEALNERLPIVAGSQPPRRMRFRDSVIDRVFADLWGCPAGEMPGAVRDRGFTSLDSFRAVAEPFVAYLKFAGRPGLPRLDQPAEG